LVFEHHGNGEHPQLQERRRQLLLWRSLGVLIAFGATLGLVRVVRDLAAGVPAGAVVGDAVVLAVDAALAVLVGVRLRGLRRR
jgi:hypothetical protein